ncbi:MAG: triose-phosphate isomerase [Nitrososphaerales archaeon]
MNLKIPILVVNYKNYPEILGRKGVELANICQEVSEELKVNIAIAPPTPFLNTISKEVNIPVFAQHVDASPLGNTTGYITAEMIKEAGALGSLINHSEHRLKRDSIKKTLDRLKANGLYSIVCARDPKEVGSLAKLKPNLLAIEPPELIGTGIAVSKAKPEVITLSIERAKRSDREAKVICGAGISTKEDVEKALSLGSLGVLVSSSIVKAKDWKKSVRELAEPLLYHQI